MGNIFDTLQNSLFKTVTSTMGYDATWTPSSPADSPTQTARVLYKGPSEKQKVVDAEFQPDKIIMQYQQGDFEGLKELADDGKFEIVNIDGLSNFKVMSVKKLFDGKTLVATLKPQK